MKLFLKSSLVLVFLIFSNAANATSFTINSGNTETTTKTLATGETGTIASGGSLIVGGDGIDANASDNVQINNAGVITVSGTNIEGIHVNDGATITNSGSITTIGGSAVAIDTDHNAIITNSGTITTSGTSSNAIFVFDNVSITNSGTITTSGAGSMGLSTEVNTTVINSGIITTSGNNSDAINTEENPNITNSGTITTLGNSSDAIKVGDNAVIVNSGTASTSGSDSHGIQAIGADNSTITNSGTVSVIGANSVAVNLGTGNSFTNTGTVTASGSATAAIAGNGDTQTITLGKGSQIIGSVDLGGGTDSITILGNGISGRLVTSNVETITVNPGVAGVNISGAIHTIDPTSSAALTIGVSNLSKTIGGAINSHVNESSKIKDEKGKTWSKIFNSNFERGSDGQNLSYDHNYRGVLVGYEQGNDSGVILGISMGDIKTNEQSFRSDVNSAFVGYYEGFKISDSIFLNTNVIAGYEQYSNERTVVDNVNGIQIANSNVNNIFISPSAEIEKRIKLHEIFELRPNASLDYTSSYFGSSSESGTNASNIAIENRDVRILNTKVGVDGTLALSKKYIINLGFGLDSRHISESKVHAAVSGVGFKFATNNDVFVNGRYMKLGLKLIKFKDLNIMIDSEIRSADGIENQESISLHASYRF